MQYLLTHLDFFIRNAGGCGTDGGATHPARGCVSLLEWQLGHQRAHINQLEDDIIHLIENANTNEPLFYRLL
ncbi:MAG: DUF484 family protein [Sodalis sp. (in: enterobacteria)]